MFELIENDNALMLSAEGKKTEYNDIFNKQTYTDYLNRLSQLAFSLFVWRDLDNKDNEILDSDFIERILHSKGSIAFVNDLIKGLIPVEYVCTGKYNYKNMPTEIQSINYNDLSPETYKSDDFVICYNNKGTVSNLSLPTLPTLGLFSYRLTSVERTLDVNIYGQKHPIGVFTNDKKILSDKNFLSKYENNEPFIYFDENFDPNRIKAINIGGQFIGNDLMKYKQAIWNEALAFLGIMPFNNDKKERNIVSEFESKEDSVNMFLNTMLSTRKKFCEIINKRYNKKYSVDYSENIMELVEYELFREFRNSNNEDLPIENK